MSRMAVGYTAATIITGIVVGLIGMATVGSTAAMGVVLGAAVGVVVQVLIFWGLFVFALPNRMLLAHGLGMMVRFATVVAVALMGVSAAGVSAAPTLFSLVACLFASTLLEAVFIRGRSPAGAGPELTAYGTHS